VSNPLSAARVATTGVARQGTTTNVQPEDPFGALDPHLPLALLPVRLETRFAEPGTDVLHVRVFPDDVHVDGHDPALTDAELALGQALWQAPADMLSAGETPPAPPPPPDGATGRRAQWSAMVRLLGGPRAAWVAHATEPQATAPATKAQAYATPPVARALPDRWLVRAYNAGTVIGEAWSAPVAANLALGPDPQAVPSASDGSDGLPVVDPGMKWLIDYPTALSVGMAVDVPLPQGTSSLDRVIAIGVRVGSPADGAGELANLLTAHRYTDGLGFLPAGSPTSNAPDARADADRNADPDVLWQQEFGPASDAGSAAPLLAGALGLPVAVLDGTAGAADPGDSHAAAMQTALWAATWGYYLGELLDTSGPSAVTIDAIRSHYLAFVRGRGTLPTLRVARQPYGVLPSRPLTNWNADGANTTVDGLAHLLSNVRPLWEYGVGVPLTASEGANFDDAFTTVMSTDAVARSYSVRSVMADRTFDPMIFTGVDPAPSHAVLDALVGGLLPGGRNPLILDVLSPISQPVRAPLVVDPTDPDPDATVSEAINALTTSNPTDVLTKALLLTPKVGGPATLLHTLLRRSLLLEYAAAGVGLTTATPLQVTGVEQGTTVARTAAAATTPAAVTEAVSFRAPAAASMLAGLSPDPGGGFTAVTSLSSAISSPVTAITGTLATGEWLWRNPTQFQPLRRNLDQTLNALHQLASLTAADLELLLPEALDLATHRFTAWAESLAAEKLSRLRQATPSGITLGGWGVVERLTRQARTSVATNLSEGAATGPLWETTRPGGFVLAPSTSQAATAAVLRAAHLAHGGDDDATCAVDLSSARARMAESLAQGIRAGQELGALLGYELERFLHERSADALIAPLRAYAPRWKASGTFVEGDPTTIVSPSAVVDGLALADDDPATVAQAVLPTGSSTSPALTSALSDGLAALQDHQHALADLLMAEAMHHTLSGNTTRASGALDAAHRGGMPPDAFDVLRTPRGGAALSARAGVVFGATAPTLAGGWPATPRGAADMPSAVWVASMLPPLSSVRIRVADASGAITDAPLPAAASIGPLDLVLDLPDVLRTRIELTLPAGSQLSNGRDPAWTPATVGLDELRTVASPLAEVLATRPLALTDLLPSSPTAPVADGRDVADLAARVSAARNGLQAALNALTAATAGAATPTGLDAARSALGTALWHGLVVQLPPTPGEDDVLQAVSSAASEIGRRLAAPTPAADATADDLVAALKGLLGSAQPALPLLSLDANTATSAAAGLAAGDLFLTATPELASDWLIDATGVRAGVGRLTAVVDGCEALAGPTGLNAGWRILDWPAAAGARWSATLDFAALSAAGPTSTSVLWCDPALKLTAGEAVCGLIVDEWVEVVPDPTAASSIAYQAQAPANRAPQAILLGLVPEVASGWTVDGVASIALDAVDLAAVRCVDAEHAAWTGRMLPAVLLPDGDAADVIAAPPLPLLQIDAGVLAAARLQVKELG
jgi:hypothetical protein